jgi:hypothetical protein
LTIIKIKGEKNEKRGNKASKTVGQDGFAKTSVEAVASFSLQEL